MTSLKFLVLFIRGDFNLDEANRYAVEAFDSNARPDHETFFTQGRGDVVITPLALSVETIPTELAFIIDNFTTIDYVDEYSFYLFRHISETWMRQSIEKANEEKMQVEVLKARKDKVLKFKTAGGRP